MSNPNSLVEKHGAPNGQTVGILETPMYPNSYYSGYIRKFPNGWWPTYNGCGYFRTLEEARERMSKHIAPPH